VDGSAHPAVVLLVMDVNGTPAFRCSATLIAPRVVLTAGHCAGEPGEFSGMRIFTESDVQNGDNNYPFAGPNTIEAVEWHAHPLFTEKDRKSTRLNSSHVKISYAVFCLKKKKNNKTNNYSIIINYLLI